MEEQTLVEIIESLDVKIVIEGFEKSRHRDYSSEFKKLAESTTDTIHQSIWKVLNTVVSYHFRPEDRSEPYGPLCQFEGKRSAIPSDLVDDELNILKALAQNITESFIKARIFDVLWLRLRQPEYANNAVHAFLELCSELEAEKNWHLLEDCIQRSLRVSVMFGRKAVSLFSSVSEYIEGQIQNSNDVTERQWHLLNMLEAAIDFGIGDLEKNHQVISSLATQFEEKFDWSRSQAAWEGAIKATKKKKSASDRIIAETGYAESLASQAQAADSGITSSHFMTKALKAYKKIPNSKPRQDELYSLLRDYQRKSLEEMYAIEGPKVDLSESIVYAKNLVKDKSFEDAIFYLAFAVSQVPKYDSLKENAIQNSQESIFSQLVGSTRLDADGLLLAEVPASFGLEDDEEGKNIWAEILKLAQIQHGLDVQGAIDPARNQICLQHSLDEKCLLHYLSDNPFIPEGHEYLFMKGLIEGFRGNFILAAHLLIPQLENSFRYVMEQHGVETSELKDYGIQERMTLRKILEHEQFIIIFGKDASLDLKGLLVDRLYANLRNQMAHGCMSADSFFQASVVYLWWLTLRLCLTPFYKPWAESISSQQTEEHANEEVA